MKPLWLLIPSGQRASGEWIDDTLRLRVAEKGLERRTPRVGDFPRQRVEVVRANDPAEAANELYRERGWTDGLPIVPPTLGRVDAALRRVSLGRHHVVGEIEPLKGVATVEKIAANAVMAGCRPEHLPVVVAAVQAIAEEEFNLRGVQTTDENVTPLLVVNGPAAERLGINADFGALGPGWQANAAIGRAVRLVMNNIGGGWPGAVSFAGLGQPGRYSLCFAENAAKSPWPPLHVESGLADADSALTVMRAESVINVTGGLAELASVMGSAASLFSMANGGRVAVVLAPFVARGLAGEGWTKDAVKRYLHEHGRMPVEVWGRAWLKNLTSGQRKWPDWVVAAAAEGRLPVVRAPEDITVIVAGADLPIPQCAYFPTWGFPPCRITKRIEIADERTA
ncbi:MAG: hypothetical protein HY521_13300 [Proteobacteria bacterium]|nr:hypothetical protein [Pseudomonadota bacterium]